LREAERKLAEINDIPELKEEKLSRGEESDEIPMVLEKFPETNNIVTKVTSKNGTTVVETQQKGITIGHFDLRKKRKEIPNPVVPKFEEPKEDDDIQALYNRLDA
jgi:hypothetical protein